MIPLMRRQFTLLCAALISYTRIPLPSQIQFDVEDFAHATRYLPIVGILIGAAAGSTLWLANLIFALPIAILLSMATSIWITGAFHEDGFADFCDGFGGGWTKEQILTIMKDSRLGSYGAIGLFLILLLKFFALSEIEPTRLIIALIAGHSLSRALAASLIYTHNYVQADAQSKVKPLAMSMTRGELTIVLIGGLAPLLIAWNFTFLYAAVAALVAHWLMARLFARRLGGYTGDCLGATQQVAEVIFYLVVGVRLL